MNNTITTPLPEAPASSTFKYIDPATGGEIMFTLRATDGIALLDKVRAALDYLVAQEAVIVPPRGTSLAARFAANGASKGQPEAPVIYADTAPQCKLHHSEMKASKYGGYYCPMPDAATEKGYCKHRVTKAGIYKGG